MAAAAAMLGNAEARNRLAARSQRIAKPFQFSRGLITKLEQAAKQAEEAR